MRVRHILAIGGGGFSFDAERGVLDDYALSLTGVDRPSVCFLGTASGDCDRERDRFYAAFPPARARPRHLSLFKRQRGDLARRLHASDLLYIGGGNTANLLAIWRLHGMDRMIRDAPAVLVGVSAGACALFAACLTDSFGPSLSSLGDGLALVPGSFCPHYDSDRRRRPKYRDAVGDTLPAGWGVDDGVALHFADGILAEVVADRPGAAAYRVGTTEERVAPRILEGGA